MALALSQLDYTLLQQCMHCGMCLPSCPTYDHTKRERHSPRGRISLMRAVADGELSVTRAFADEMDYCVGCLACQSACPAGVRYGALLEAARSDIQAHGLASGTERFWRAVTLGGLFLHPRLLRVAARLLRAYQQSGMDVLVRRAGMLRVLPSSLRVLEPRSPRIAAAFSNQVIAAREGPSAGEARYRVACLTGCVQDLVFSQINRDTVDVLVANGCEVETPPVQPCCGSLHAHNGDLENAQTLARRLLDLFPVERYDAIVSNAGGCGSHLRHYGELLGGDPRYADRARLWDAKVKDIHEWLVEIGYRAPRAAPFDHEVVVTYHESCHLVHSQRVSQAPRALLKALPGVTVVELPEATWCCGSAGIYAVTQPEESALLLQRKVNAIEATGATIVAVANPGCQLQIEHGLRREAGRAPEVCHPVTLLAAAYRREGATVDTGGLPTLTADRGRQ